jgi:predicted ATPase
MNIKELKIKGFKSIGEIVLKSPNPFSVFVGANGAGKSNIFEALEFLNYCNIMDPEEAIKYFGKLEDVINRNHSSSESIIFEIYLDTLKSSFVLTPNFPNERFSNFAELSWNSFGKHLREQLIKNGGVNVEKTESTILDDTLKPEYLHLTNFTRLFISKSSLLKRNMQDDSQIALDASNLEKVLKRIFRNKAIKDEIVEILQLLVPGFDSIEIVSEELSGTDSLLVYETSLKKPLTKRLISDGTYNILAILAAIYQSDKPQFLCIEEPENGLNPKVIRELVNIIRRQCEEHGHYIWLNTHSQTLVSELRPEEIILVDKVNGMTQTKQVTGMNLHGLKMDEALLTNALGGGIPW